MRGTAGVLRGDELNSRITPAHAGNSFWDHSGQYWKEDHPRTCGEQTAFSDGWASNAGSPPHMRGTVYGGIANRPPPGITPAHAGNSDL